MAWKSNKKSFRRGKKKRNFSSAEKRSYYAGLKAGKRMARRSRSKRWY